MAARATFTCGNHGNHVTDVLLSALVGKGLQNRLYALALFLRSSSYYLRLLDVVASVLSRLLVVVQGHPPPGAGDVGNQLMSHMVYHYRAYERSCSEADAGQAQEGAGRGRERGGGGE